LLVLETGAHLNILEVTTMFAFISFLICMLSLSVILAKLRKLRPLVITILAVVVGISFFVTIIALADEYNFSHTTQTVYSNYSFQGEELYINDQKTTVDYDNITIIVSEDLDAPILVTSRYDNGPQKATFFHFGHNEFSEIKIHINKKELAELPTQALKYFSIS
jgi:hypothetical protein